MYRVANASEYLVITGVGITDIKLAKKGMNKFFIKVVPIHMINLWKKQIQTDNKEIKAIKSTSLFRFFLRRFMA